MTFSALTLKPTIFCVNISFYILTTETRTDVQATEKQRKARITLTRGLNGVKCNFFIICEDGFCIKSNHKKKEINKHVKIHL